MPVTVLFFQSPNLPAEPSAIGYQAETAALKNSIESVTIV
jgi:hypothetical protein